VEVASKDELQQIIGYASTGVTPLGVDSIKIFVDRSLLDFETILTGAGIPGVEIELSPNDLMNLTGALLLDIILT
jgi:Cys-tRNA(Pro)/Cys-tRNA(Cys) deacylase